MYWQWQGQGHDSVFTRLYRFVSVCVTLVCNVKRLISYVHLSNSEETEQWTVISTERTLLPTVWTSIISFNYLRISLELVRRRLICLQNFKLNWHINQVYVTSINTAETICACAAHAFTIRLQLLPFRIWRGLIHWLSNFRCLIFKEGELTFGCKFHLVLKTEQKCLTWI